MSFKCLKQTIGRNNSDNPAPASEGAAESTGDGSRSLRSCLSSRKSLESAYSGEEAIPGPRKPIGSMPEGCATALADNTPIYPPARATPINDKASDTVSALPSAPPALSSLGMLSAGGVPSHLIHPVWDRNHPR
ncbi:hypothetical protein WJX73_002884 [Symbiochloris irregularis]|uniref:Uncharacterized protein n=1 Tax=Symbiochloris irregularis TaxID=706552 RepID=A0AAW1P2S3_9CHLO